MKVQHKGYKNVDQHEFVRYNDLFMCFGSRFIFVRINPDSYRDAKRTLHTGTLVQAFNERKDKVVEVLKQAIDKAKQDIDPAEPLVLVWHLFFDGYPKGIYGPVEKEP